MRINLCRFIKQAIKKLRCCIVLLFGKLWFVINSELLLSPRQNIAKDNLESFLIKWHRPKLMQTNVKIPIFEKEYHSEYVNSVLPKINLHCILTSFALNLSVSTVFSHRRISTSPELLVRNHWVILSYCVLLPENQ